MTDPLSEFVQTGSAEAFRRVVERHADSVYSQCLRELHDQTLAEEATQAVFITLTRKAAGLSGQVVLAGWLFNTTRFCCAAIARAERRRRRREQTAMQMRQREIESSSADPRTNDMWADAQPLLNDALARLNARDRNAVLLRFFEGQTLQEVGEAMGISEDAAKQRVVRAVEKLRGWFERRGITAPSATVITWLSSSVKPIPPHLVSAIVSRALPQPRLFRWNCLGTRAAAVTGIATILIVAGAAAAVIALADARSASSSDAATQPVPATPAAAELNTPADVMRKLSAAIKQNDQAAIDACLTDDGVDQKTAALIRANLHLNAASCRLTRASAAAFGDQMQLQNFGFDLLPGLHGGFEVLIDRSLEVDGGAPVTTVEDDIA
jgi:RNA polymerase sigma factor (sigma-70 family)